MKTKEQLIKIYSAYLAYDLKLGFEGEDLENSLVGVDMTHDGLQLISPYGDFGRSEIYKAKPILYSMNMLTKEIEHKGERFIPIEWLEENYTDHKLRFEKPDCLILYDDYSLEQNIFGAPLAIYEKLLEWHFNVFGLDESEYIQKQSVIQK